MKKIIRHIVFFSVLYIVLFPPSAHAYLDPGTGSYILQIVAAVFFAGLFLIKTWWTQIKGFLGRFANKKEGKEVKNSEKSSGKKKE
jgi:hydrogenase-4 membrane subunit HyfE